MSCVLSNLEPECIVLDVHRLCQLRRLVVGRIVRQAQHKLVLALPEQLRVEAELVAHAVANGP